MKSIFKNVDFKLIKESTNGMTERRSYSFETPIYIFLSLELQVARAELSDLRALDTLRGNKCASLRFHGRRYVVLVTACLFVSSLHDRGTFMNVITLSFRHSRDLIRD